MNDILPDSRADYTKGCIYTPAGVYIPYFCGNCGKECGWCPEDATFMFYLCRNCEGKYGEVAGLMRLPDEDYWEKLKQEQMASYGHYLTQEELAKVVEEDNSPLARLLKEAK